MPGGKIIKELLGGEENKRRKLAATQIRGRMFAEEDLSLSGGAGLDFFALLPRLYFPAAFALGC